MEEQATVVNLLGEWIDEEYTTCDCCTWDHEVPMFCLGNHPIENAPPERKAPWKVMILKGKNRTKKKKTRFGSAKKLEITEMTRAGKKAIAGSIPMQSTSEKVNFASCSQHVFSRKNKKAIMKQLQDKE
ncbi:hypothetical protein SADUNF_Sadunf01G0108100 [Salix dunnii]|uniref:Uncharacterized protein n=1 Tax=Salix dunnii TaxID=1413687 RepID=A0A835NAP8_9ROSI|nr:hypothetical protein SADUNF_Sadunf01G0108100 [Salix dunnii]